MSYTGSNAYFPGYGAGAVQNPIYPLPLSRVPAYTYSAWPQAGPVPAVVSGAPVASASPATSNPALSQDTFQTDKRKMMLAASSVGVFGLGTLLYLTRHKLPPCLRFWSIPKPGVKLPEPPRTSPLKPLSFCNDAEAVRHRHAMSVSIVNELWPNILKFAEHKPDGWDKTLEAKYCQIIQKHLKEPYAKVNVAFDKDTKSTMSMCSFVRPETVLPTNKTTSFVIGGLDFATPVTHFNPKSIDGQQKAFATLTHETDHLLRGLSANKAQRGDKIKWGLSPSGAKPLGTYEGSYDFLRDIIAKAHTSDRSGIFPAINPRLNGDADQLVNLSESQKKHYWQLIQDYWNDPKHADVYKDWHQSFLNTRNPEDMHLAVPQYYLSELEAHLLAMHRAPGNSLQITEHDIEDGARALFLRQKIRAYYDHFKIPPEQQSDLVKDWKLELMANPKP
jgi:hypothetical protein